MIPHPVSPKGHSKSQEPPGETGLACYHPLHAILRGLISQDFFAWAILALTQKGPKEACQ